MKNTIWLRVLLSQALFVCSALTLFSQNADINKSLLNSFWPSEWIAAPDAPAKDYGVYHFRKTINLANKPDKFVVHVSADNRYRLFVNGESVCIGPARGDLFNWYFETLDIAPYLKQGENTIAAAVWNMGTLAPVAQISNRTGFVMQGDSEQEQIINTNASWKAIKNKSFKPCSTDTGRRLRAYVVVGPGDEINGDLYPWGWEQLGYDDSNWQAAVSVAGPTPVGVGTDNFWHLTPRNIPLMEESFQRMGEVRRSENIKVSDGFLKGNSPLIIGPNKKASFLIDQGYNTIAYPHLIVSKGTNASIKLTYTEALLDKNFKKGNRNEIEGLEVIGNYDIFHADGGEKRDFYPLWLRTYRYIQVDIETKDEPLTIEDAYGMYTGYPFEVKASFESDDKSMKDIWDVGWRTARLCAGETYYDCPYYEQLQYPGDTRIQAFISLYVTGDDRLMRKAILDFYNSRVPEGLTQGRYPSNRLQVIPPYSLYWISMIYDYWMYREDNEFVEQFLPAIDGVLTWYENNIDKNKGMLGGMKWWNFTDYTIAFSGGVAPGSNDGNSSVLSLHYVYTLRQAAKLYEYFDKKCEADRLLKIADDVSSATFDLCFNPMKMQMADTPEKQTYSQHAGIMALLSETIDESSRQEVMKQIVEDSTMGPVTFYYRFYLTQALKLSGMGDEYYKSLEYWRGMLKDGLTTFAETPWDPRSDCHAWSASPLYDYFAIICGIVPASNGFNTVSITPSLGELKEVKGSIPHPKGDIKVELKRKGALGIDAQVTLPTGITGYFDWAGKQVQLKSGSQTFSID